MNISDIERLLDNSATIETKIEILPRYAGESLITITNDDSIKSWEYADTRYVPDNGFIGMFVERTLEGELHNITTDFNIENREIILYLGIRVYDVDSKTYTTTFYSLGNFIVDKPDSDEVKDNTKFTAKDYTIKFNRAFNPDFTDSEYTKSFTTLLSEQGSVTALWLAKYTCKQSGVELGSESFANSTFNITSNQFQNGEQCRDIIKAIAKLACTWARIDWDNKLYLDFDVKFAVEQDYNNITKDDYYSLTIQKDSFGPINKVVFGSSIIDGDYSFVSDENSISQHGENVVTIYDNPILYTEELREEAVKVGTRLLGLTYTPVEMETIGHPWLKGNELITVLDSAYNIIYTYPFDRVIKYDGHIKTEIKSYSPTKVQADFTYQGTGTSKNARKQTKIILDRANQQITSLIEKTDETTSQITSINQNLDKIELDVDTLNTKFESIGVTSKTVEGNPIHITDAGDYDLDRLYLEGNSYQETTTGKNSFMITDLSQLNINVIPTDLTINKTNNIISFTSVNSSTNGIYILAGKMQSYIKNVDITKNYYISADITVNSKANYRFGWEGTAEIKGILETGTTRLVSKFTPTTAFIFYLRSTNVTATISNIMISESEDTTYEPYTGGQPSPSPDYPQEIEVVEGSVDVEVIGKNICPTDVSDWVLGQWTITGGTGTYENRIRVNRLVPCKPNTTYYVQTFLASRAFAIRTFKKDESFNTSIGAVGTGRTFTTDENSYYLAITIYSELGGTEDLLALIESGEIKPFICLDSETDKTYEPYKSTTASLDLQDNFIAKIGDVKDELDVVTGKLTKRIGKVVLDGSENWKDDWQNSAIPDYIQFYLPSSFLNNNYEKTTHTNNICTHFKTYFNAPSTVWIANEICYALNPDNKYSLQFKLNKSYISSLEQWKTWLSQNNVEVYYVLAEPYEVQLDSTSIELNEGVNNIHVKTNISPSFISLTYLTDSVLNSQYATKTQLQLTKDNITSVVQDTLTLNTDLTNLQSLVGTETTNLKNSLGDLTNNLEENYATNNSVLTIENSVSNIQTSLNQQIEITKDIQVNGVSKVKTTTGFTFDENGMTVTKTNADTKTTIDEDGMVVYSTTGSNNIEMLVVDSKGVVAENVSVNTFLIVGKNSRFQDYETGTGCFYIGE